MRSKKRNKPRLANYDFSESMWLRRVPADFEFTVGSEPLGKFFTLPDSSTAYKNADSSVVGQFDFHSLTEMEDNHCVNDADCPKPKEYSSATNVGGVLRPHGDA
jgi:hypothetical protein